MPPKPDPDTNPSSEEKPAHEAPPVSGHGQSRDLSACDTPTKPWIDIRAARQLVLDHAQPLMRTEQLAVVDATGRLLAEDVLSDSDMPPFDRVMMDGYAVRAEDIQTAPVELPVVGEVAAGDSGSEPLEPGTVRAIMTGAPLPPGADSVVPVEWTQAVGGGAGKNPERVRIERSLIAGKHVAQRAQDLGAGDAVAHAGTRVGPLGLSLLVSSGVSEVAVRARPRVALLTSGDELVPPGSPIARGQIRESNGPALASMFARCDAEVVPLGVARDTREDLAALVQRALDCDVVVLTGGSSVGRYDFSAEVVESFGARGHFNRLSVKPGKPTLFYTLGRTLLFCLPGNPVAAMMTGRVLVCPALQALAGHAVQPWTPVSRPLARSVRRNAARDLLIPVHEEGGAVVFDGWHGSGDLVSMQRADAFAYVPSGEGEAAAGSDVDVFPLTRDVSW